MHMTSAAGGPALTMLAERYTHPTGKEHKVISYTGLSGMTPLVSPSSPTIRSRKKHAQLDGYQRRRFQAISTKELESMGAFAPRFFDFLYAVNIPINPLFHRDKWDYSLSNAAPSYRLPGGLAGYWEAQNDLVWQMIQEPLKLASCFLENLNVIPWSIILLNGDYTSIENGIPDVWKGGKLQRVRRRPGLLGVPPGFRPKREKMFKNIIFRITSGHTEPHAGWQSGDFFLGRTWSAGDMTVIDLALEVLEPFLISDISPAERQLDVFRVAVILLHEISHAMWSRAYQGLGRPAHFPEPYFEEQCIAELGFSFEEAVFGGRPTYLTALGTGKFVDGNGLSCGAVYSSGWFNSLAAKYVQPERPDSFPAITPLPPDWNEMKSYPIPLEYFQSLSHSDFWTVHARAYQDAIKMGPKLLGTRLLITNQTLDIMTVQDSEDRTQIPIDVSAAPTVQSATEFENMRRARARKIIEAGTNIQAKANARLPQLQATMNSDINARGRSNSASSGSGRTEDSNAPPCTRYEEIRRYLFANSGQGRLCLDTMYFDMPENTLLNHIMLLGGIRLTVQEWRGFLRLASDRNEFLNWVPTGRGIVRWTALQEIYPNPSYVSPFSQFQLAQFQAMSTHNNWPASYFHDIDPNMFLVEANNYFQDILSNTIWDANDLRAYIDHHDATMTLWCWGPNGVIRRL